MDEGVKAAAEALGQALDRAKVFEKAAAPGASAEAIKAGIALAEASADWAVASQLKIKLLELIGRGR